MGGPPRNKIGHNTCEQPDAGSREHVDSKSPSTWRRHFLEGAVLEFHSISRASELRLAIGVSPVSAVRAPYRIQGRVRGLMNTEGKPCRMGSKAGLLIAAQRR